MKTARGFTILEMVIVIVLMGIVSAAVIGMVARIGSGSTENAALKVGAQLVQECGEWVLANHRRDEKFYTDVLVVGTSTNCFSGPGSYGGFTAPSVEVTDISADTTNCPQTPSPAECKKAVITLTNGSITLHTANLIVVKYN